jgi:hypothetical protein|tara:strand:+ start:1334 stop:1951 length:618 start_codon:yes stop_codon:yes gene_type:complete
MKYYIIANNTKITQQSINKLELDGENLLVLFNYLWPLRFQEVLDYENKICISRKGTCRKHSNDRPNRYFNIVNIRGDQDLFKKIYFLPHPSQTSITNRGVLEREIAQHNFDKKKLGILDSNFINPNNHLLYPLIAGTISMSTGLQAYEYFKNTKNNNDDIILVGFDSNVSNSWHNSRWEKMYMLRQIYMDKCDFIQCYGLTERIS